MDQHPKQEGKHKHGKPAKEHSEQTWHRRNGLAPNSNETPLQDYKPYVHPSADQTNLIGLHSSPLQMLQNLSVESACLQHPWLI